MIKEKLASAPSSAQKEKLQVAINKRNEVESSKVTLSDRIKQLDTEKTAIMDQFFQYVQGRHQ